MRVAFLVNDLQLSGGVGVVVEHARRLAGDHGFGVDLVLVREQDDPSWEYEGLAGLPVLTLDQARAEHYDVAVATWWETTFSLFDVSAERYAYFIQSLEDRFYPPGDARRFGAALTHDLPVDFITEARWIADTLERLRPGTRVFYVRNGIHKDDFPLPESLDVRMGGPLRVLIEGYPQVWFKGVEDAAWAAGAMREPRHITIVTPDASALSPGVPADEVIGPLSRRELSDRYAESDVVLKLSRVEGMFGPPLEGFHRGATAVVAPVTGHEEYVSHGWNALVTGWDDPHGTARALDLLARDRRTLHFLRTNAVETARGWPGWEQSSQFMAAALRRIRALPPPSPYTSGRALAADVRAWADAGQRMAEDRERMLAELRWPRRVRGTGAFRALARLRRSAPGRALVRALKTLLRRGS